MAGWLDEGTAIFAFRCTASAQDGMQDVSKSVDYLQELYPGVKGHTGIFRSLLLMHSSHLLLRYVRAGTGTACWTIFNLKLVRCLPLP